MPKVGEHYTHYKGTEYEIVCLATQSETQEQLVVYQDCLNPEKIWARPLAMFMETVEINGHMMPRFTKIT